MLKLTGMLTVLVAALATGAMMPGEEQGCAAGKCGSQKDTALAEQSCGQCPAMATSQLAGKSCSEGQCTAGSCSKACSEGCGSTVATSSDTTAACAAGGKCAEASCSKACSEGCGSTVATSSETTAACAEGKCTSGSCTAGEGCTIATSAQSAEDATCAGGACGTSACGAACGKDCSDCPVTAAMNQLPRMTFAVGTEKTCCPKEAKELVEKSGGKVQFVVADKTYDEENAAKQVLVETTEQFVAAFIEPKVCKESGNISVAGKQACCEGTAAELSSVAKAAMEKVQLSYVVGDKQCHCPVEAEKLAKDSGEVTIFVVGEEKTACNVTARLNLARAKFRAAVVALLQSQPQTTETSATGS